MPRFPLRSASLAAALLLIALPVSAGTWYVDAQSGNDANDGLTPGTAWRTITHAVATIAALPIDAQTIYVAPGVYNAALGEVFPLFPAPRTHIVGTAGAAQTILEGPAPYLLRYHPNATPVDAQSGADGLTLRQAVTGVLVGSGSGNASPAFHDLRIENMSGPGVSVTASSNGPFGGAGAGATFERLEIVQCDVGVLVAAQGGSLGSASAGIELTDSVVRASTNNGIHFSGAGNAGANVRLRRCRVLGNGGHGAYSSSGGGSGATTSSVLTADASLFAGNGGSGLFGEGSGSTFGGFTLNDCTIAGNTVSGVSGTFNQQATLRNTIVFQNGNDLDLLASPSASFSNSGDGDLLGYPGCIAADPRFVNTTIGDFRLRFGSPSAETGDPISSGALDLLGHARPFDGNLDTQKSVDMGAYELEPLHLLGAPALGQVFGFELWGQTGASATLLLAKAPLTAAQSTPFGDFYLAPGQVLTLGDVPAQLERPFVLRRVVPNDPALVGVTFSFQALTTSSLAPQGRAYTNPVSFVVAP